MAVERSLFIYFILGTLSTSLGLLIGYALPPLVETIINQQISLTPDSKSYPMWKETPTPIYQKFYFFNVTNPQQIEMGFKPRLEEIGPFTYRSEWRNEDIELSDDSSTIDFRHIKHWHFEPELSIADHRLQIVTINAPLAITMSLIQSAPNAVRYFVTFSLDGFSEGFFTKRTIQQLLFDGYPDLLTTMGPILNSEMLSQGGHFAYFNSKNNSEDGHYEINTGWDDINKLNTINKFNGRSQLSYWSQREGSCNSLKGATTGEMFPPLEPNQTTLRLFQPDFCRVWPLNHEYDYEHSSGLSLKRFRASRDIFKNYTDFPENSCYYVRTGGKPLAESSQLSTANHHPRPHHLTNNNQVNRNQRNNNNNNQQHNHRTGLRLEWPNGVFSLAPCRFNAPIYLSMPHFLDADPYFGRHVNGLKPDANKHDFYLDIEPRTGAPVRGSARVQVNLAISRPPGLIRLRNIPEIMFPVFWQELSVELSGNLLDNLHLASRGAQEIVARVSYVFSISGIAILLVVLLFYFIQKSFFIKTDKE